MDLNKGNLALLMWQDSCRLKTKTETITTVVLRTIWRILNLSLLIFF